MKPLALNLSKMKKIGGDKSSSTFLHPDGHQIKVAHAPLSAIQRKQIEKMPVHKFADGGDAEPNSSPLMQSDVPVVYERGDEDQPTTPPAIQLQNPADANRSPASFAGDLGNVVRQSVQDTAHAFGSLASPVVQAGKDFVHGLTGTPAEAAETASGSPAQAPASSTDAGSTRSPADDPELSQQPQTQNSGMPKSPVDLNAAYQQGQNAITEQQKVNEATSKADLDIAQKDAADRQALNQKFNDQMNAFNQQQQAFLKDYANQHIDPRHYQENMGTGQKVATGIGLLLSGMGAAKTGGPNLAYDMLNKQIDRDIAGQQARMDQSKTILGANQALYHDNVLAMNQTRINMNDIYDHQIQAAAAALGTPQAKASADAAHAQFAMQNYQLLQQNALRSTVLQHLGQGGTGLTAIDLANAGLIPSHEDAMKEQASIDGQKKAMASANAIFSKYQQEQTAGNFLNPESHRRVNAINAELTNLIMESDAAKRLTPESAKLEVEPFFVKTGDDQKTVRSKLNGIYNLIRQHAAPTPYMSHYAPQSLPQYEAMNEPEIQTRNGVKYQKVPGGWKKVQ